MKKIMMMALLSGLTGGASAAEMCAGALVCIPGPRGQTMPSGKYSPEFADLAVHASDLKTPDAAPAVPAPAAQGADFDVRKVFLMPETETWKGPFVIQFRKGADLPAVMNVLKKVGLEAKELVDNGDGLYARIEMEYEFAPVTVMRLTDYTSVASVQVNKRLWGMMTSY
ncbi:MAG: hypothetical protein NTX59_00510 [Elusimicrobia bacterium]|nr:hypothetical protein [Elusimicrobiota bacterium]